ncbi:MAG TPA: murein biosynthesis integral membrane protein MurJ [Jiangellaceae bacterium]|jgi:putative peptidoglycan lipid II flippase|nr:murein biosynthesis integral membrane protein MurJ [Jiangellaceae bacterium]
MTARRGLLGSSAVMAAGTVVSRLTGFARAMIIAAAIGLGVTADTFNVPNVIPNTLYILVGGGVLNSVLVPALVRAIKEDADGGEGYSQRLFSVVVLVLGVASVVCVLAAPWLVRAFVSPEFLTPRLEPFFENMVMFARFCLPQIFFYGLYVLIGQMLNARGRFGPMMWAPIINNVVAIAVFAAFILVMGTNTDRPFTDTEVLVLGLGSTVGVAAQALILLPVLRRTGFRIRLRTDWRHAGLGVAARLGLWTIAFVLVNQVAYLFVVRTATGGAAGALVDASTTGAGYSVYANAMLIIMVPHSVITVSLATALLPQLSDHAADGDLALVRERLTDAIRVCLAVIVPVAALLAALSVPFVRLLFDHGAATDDTGELAATLAALVPGLIAFTVHYMVLRGFYALQDTRTPFFVQLWVSGTVIAVALVIATTGPTRVTVLLAAGFSLAYLVGATVSIGRLGRRIGGMPRWPLVGYVLRLLVPATVGALAAYALTTVLDRPLDGLAGWLGDLVALAVGGTAGLLLYVALGYLMRITVIRDTVTAILRRVRRRPPSMRSDGGSVAGSPAVDDAPDSTPGEP